MVLVNLGGTDTAQVLRHVASARFVVVRGVSVEPGCIEVVDNVAAYARVVVVRHRRGHGRWAYCDEWLVGEGKQ